MAINISAEQLIQFKHLSSHLQKRTGKRIHKATFYRWRKVGIKGVRLEFVLIGGSPFTSEEALNRFFARTTEAKQAGHSATAQTSMDRAKIAREKQLDREAEELGL